MNEESILACSKCKHDFHRTQFKTQIIHDDNGTYFYDRLCSACYNRLVFWFAEP